MSKTIDPSKKPYPLRLGDLKAPLQMKALQDDRSLAYLIKKILTNYAESENLIERKPDKK